MNSSFLYDEDGVYIGPESEYNEFGVDTRTGEPFYNNRICLDTFIEAKAEANRHAVRKMKIDSIPIGLIAKWSDLSIEEMAKI